MPEITRRSSTRRAPGWFDGRCGAIADHAASDNQNNDPTIPTPPSIGDPLNQHPLPKSIGQLGLDPKFATAYVPFAASCLLSIMSLVSFIRVTEKSDYLKKIEGKYALEGLGWERRINAHPKKLAWTNWAMWFAIISGDAYAATGFCYPLQNIALCLGFLLSFAFQFSKLSNGEQKQSAPISK